MNKQMTERPRDWEEKTTDEKAGEIKKQKYLIDFSTYSTSF